MRDTVQLVRVLVPLAASFLLTLPLSGCGGTGDPCDELAQRLYDCTGKRASAQFFESCRQNKNQAATVADVSCETIDQASQGKADLGEWWDWMKDWWYETDEDTAEDESSAADPVSEFLDIGRESCSDIITIEIAPGQEAIIAPFEYLELSVSSHEIPWQCDGEPRPALKCPETTNFVQIDRRLASTIFTFTCFHTSTPDR